MHDMDEMIRRIRRDMNVQLRKRAGRAAEPPAGEADPEPGPHTGRPVRGAGNCATGHDAPAAEVPGLRPAPREL
ncbi:hypothetical protein GCM10010359_61300 [Streptomyces morookaense]|nr:hypothetical protein GCM10010359_61300 [Streptomyces morookaense]